MKTFSLTFTAGQTMIVPGGNFFMLLASTYPVSVDPQSGGSSMAEQGTDVEPGYTIRAPIIALDGSNYFDAVKITSDVAQTIKVAVSLGAGSYQRQVGVVQTIPSAFDEAKDGELWNCHAQHAGVAGQYSYSGLLNTDASEYDLFITQIAVSIGTPGGVFYLFGADGGVTVSYTAELCWSSDVGNWNPTDFEGARWNSVNSPLGGSGMGGSTPAQFRFQTSSTDTFNYTFENPLILTPGKAVIFGDFVLNQDISSNIFFRAIKR